MKLTFCNSYGDERVIADVKDEKEAFDEMKRFCDERNFEIHYYRCHAVGKRRCYDVGSWSEFFYLEYNSEEEARLV